MSAPLVQATRSAHVVVAEDDDEMRRLLGDVLRHDGFDVTELADGAALFNYIGIAWVSDHGRASPDLIISDVRMPGFSGLEILDLLYQADSGLPVILITAFGDEDLHARAHALGVRAVFDKPFDLDDLRTAALFYATPPAIH